MKIIRKYKPKDEDKYFEPFLEFYLSRYFPQVEEVNVQSPDESNQFKRPDYYIIQASTLVEAKEVHDRKDNEAWIKWHYRCKELEENINNASRMKNVTGTFLIFTPLNIRIQKGKERTFKDAIFEAISSSKTSCDVLGYHLDIRKASNQGSVIVFSTSSGGSIDPAQTIYNNISEKLTTANVQLKFQPEKGKVPKRILLLVNKYIFGERIHEVTKALSYNYDKLLTYNSIDEIWLLQTVTTEGKPPEPPNLLYKRMFLEQYHNKKLTPSSDNELFKKWFSALAKIGDEHKDRLLCGLKAFLKDKKPFEVFADEYERTEAKYARTEMVRLGDWLAKEERFDDVIWLIEKFIDDPDPEEPENYHGNPDFNYHQQIVEGKDNFIITTVRGSLVWVVQKLTVEKDYIVKAFDYTETLLGYKNLYAKLQAIVPLIEIAARRQWLEEKDSEKYKQFHNVCFGLLRNYSKYPAIAKLLAHVFFYYKDLTTAEACEVLENLRITDKSASLFIYFALFRERHYKNPDGTDKKGFESGPLKKKLEEVIRNNDDTYLELRSRIMWHFWKLLKENPEEFKTVRHYIDLFLRQPYKINRYTEILYLVKDQYQKEPETCVEWFELMLSNISEFVKMNKDEAKFVWLDSEKIMSLIANKYPEKLVSLTQTLVNLWMKGAFVGSPKQVFETFRLIPDEEAIYKVRREFQKMYQLMRKVHPKVEKVDWRLSSIKAL